MQDLTSTYLTTKRDVTLAAWRSKQLEMPTTVQREIIIGKYEASENRLKALIG